MVRRIGAILAAASLVCGYTTVVSAAADAASPTTSGKHCRVNVETGSTSCYPTVTALLASFGVERPGATSIGAGEVSAIELASQVLPQATVVLSVVYDNADYDISDGSYTYIASAGCDGDAGVEWQLANVGSTWNDRITSYQGYNKCQSTLYEDADFAGSQYGPKKSSTNVGTAMNDKTTSITWS